ncbi:MAG: tetratricopeptide repeat protein, partial [Verrucomicrobia bacterium]|nr:tetratricopeptide repeat protein [Verrucomicrobiota bacterium]
RKRYPDRPVIAYLLGIASSQAKHHEESVQAFADALVIAETNQREMLNGEFYFSYGAAAEQAGKVDKAVDLLKLSIKMEPEVPQAYNYLGYMWADRKERLEEAAEMIKKALSLEPGKGEYLDSLGWCSFRKGEFEQALKELLEARASILREDKKDDPTVLDHLGEVYLQMGKISEAVGLWEKSLVLEGNKKVAEKLRLAKEKLGKD